ncbi:MAG: MBL fold metallo-hydrolase [Clostridiales bacterium]|jgi:phosphoribosyl 1,2-cyclic phosphodiesterase|nr:MBL fold metallo-hydrolase [Clostridiales bacterium]
MSLALCALASGSKGNSTLIEGACTKILVDAGLCYSELTRRLRSAYAAPQDIAGIVVTHAHGDHIAGLEVWTRKHNTPIYAHYDVARALYGRLGGFRNIVELDGGDFFIGEFTITPFRVPHDVTCIGISAYAAGHKISVLTDLGVMPPRVLNEIKDSEIVLLECNHDVDTLLANPKYPQALKRRILSGQGHLSNEASAEAIEALARGGVRQVVLGHLSEENNTPALALAAVMQRLERSGLAERVRLAVAGQHEPTDIYRVI